MCEEKIANLYSDYNISIRALRREARNVISTLVNPQRFFPTEKGLQRDWQGLAQLCDISGEKMPYLQQSRDPSNEVLEMWVSNNKNESTIDKLLLFFEEMDRFDVIYDLTPFLEKDIEDFKRYPNGFTVDYPYIDDKGILTLDDVERKSKGLPPQTYDAFVLFADDDIEFSTKLIKKLEDDYNLKLCVKDRDVVAGVEDHDSVVQLISRRCGRLVVIISPSFFASPSHKFFYDFAQLEGIEQRRRKIIPCLIKPCDNLPPDFKLYVVLDYMRQGRFNNFYEKLSLSIRTHQSPCLSENPVLQRSMETLKPQTKVQFNSMVNLNHEESVSDKITTPSVTMCVDEITSISEPIGMEPLKKKNSFYKKFKNLKKTIVSKSTERVNDEPDDKITVVKKKSKIKLWKKVAVPS